MNAKHVTFSQFCSRYFLQCIMLIFLLEDMITKFSLWNSASAILSVIASLKNVHMTRSMFYFNSGLAHLKLSSPNAELKDVR